jgi:hypothetical protein
VLRRAAKAARPSRKSSLTAQRASRRRSRFTSNSPRAMSLSDSFMPRSASGAPASSAPMNRCITRSSSAAGRGQRVQVADAQQFVGGHRFGQQNRRLAACRPRRDT